MIVLVTTCERPGSSYLPRLLTSIEQSGWSGPCFIVSDGPTSIATSFPVFASRKRQGQMRTYWRAMQIGAEQARRLGHDRVVILEDDVELCRNALTYMDTVTLPPVDFVTWFDGHVIPEGARPGIYRVPAERFFCLQAVTWTPAALEILLASPRAVEWRPLHEGDVLIAQILSGRRYGVHIPNLAQHMGSVSLCNPGEDLSGVRTANNYPGQHFNALRLVPAW